MSRSTDSLPTLRLLIVSGTQEDVEAIQAAMKQHGIAVRISAPTTAADAMAAITGNMDLIIADPKYPMVPFTDLVRESRKVEFGEFEPEIPGSPAGLPILALTSDMEGYGTWLSQGADGVMIRGQEGKFIRLVHQGWALVRARRAAGFSNQALREAEVRCNSLIDSSRDAIAYLHEGLHVRTNSAYLDLFKAENAEDLDGLSILDLVAAKQQGAIKDLLKRVGRGEKAPEGMEIEAQSLDGETWMGTMSFEPATFDGERCLQMVVRKRVEESNVSQEQIKALLSKDPVTGLLARGKFLEALEDGIRQAKDKQKTFAFFLVEPDHYARVLGQVGLTHGDALVGAVAGRLVEALKKTLPNESAWQAGRLGDHQLSVIAEVNGMDQAKEIANAIMTTMAGGLVEAAGHSVSITVCVGGILMEARCGDLGTTLGKVHGIMHDIQQGSGNRMLVHDPGADDKKAAESKQKLVDRIRESIDGDSFLVRYQPLVALHGALREFYELHIDIPRQEGETQMPDWMVAAGDAGLLWEVDRWRVAKAIADIDMRARLGHDTHMLVPISSASIQDDSLVQLITSEMGRYTALAGRGGGRLTLMLPEAQISTHLKLAQAFRLKMSNLGVMVGLDNFGGGMGGQGIDPGQMLAHFGADRLRLTSDLVSGLVDTTKAGPIRELLTQVKTQKREILASGVESAGTMSALFNAGVDYAQGTFLAHVSSKMDHEF